MPICTYLSTVPDSRDIKNVNVRELLDELNAKFKDKWAIRETAHVVGFFRKKIKYTYELFFHVGGPEYQIINFYSEDSESSINLGNSASVVCAFMLGSLGTVCV